MYEVEHNDKNPHNNPLKLQLQSYDTMRYDKRVLRELKSCYLYKCSRYVRVLLTT